MKLINLESKGQVIFVGDTHGDFKTSKKIIEKYLGKAKICFLGDYVDRGEQSKENADFLLNTREQNPEELYLLQGNHENFKNQSFMPCDFWYQLIPQVAEQYDSKFQKLPLAISIGGIIATHAALPDIQNLDEINQIKHPDQQWYDLIWGDLTQNPIDYVLPREENGMRSKTGRSRFERIMKQIGKNVLIRSHDYKVPETMFNNRCLTLFTSQIYEHKKKKIIAIADFNKSPEIKSIDDLLIKEI